jgi:hypothetical protein
MKKPAYTGISLMVLIVPLILLFQSENLFAQGNVAIAGQDVNLRLGFTLQPRFTYANESVNDVVSEQIGFGVRRFRMRTYMNVGEDFKLFTQWEGSGTGASLIDLRAEYRLNDKIWLRMGRFVGAQPRVMAITLHSEIDLIERPGIADVWARHTIGADARDYGLEMLYRNPTLEYRLFLSNGGNAFNYRNNYSGNALVSAPGKGMALNTMVRYFPEQIKNTEFGVHAGVNHGRSTFTASSLAPGVGRNYTQASGYAYWGVISGQQPVRVKFDAITVQYEDIMVAGSDFSQTFRGASLFTGYLVRRDLELLAALETYNLNIDDPNQHVDLLTMGFTYSFSAARGQNFLGQKLTVAYSAKANNKYDRLGHLLIAQFQILL